jgi:hypothetical protein
MFTPPECVQLQWNEPLFFRLRTIRRSGLLIRGCLFLTLCALFTAGFLAEARSPRGLHRNLPEGVILVLLCSSTIALLFEAPNLWGVVRVSPDDISWTSLTGPGVGILLMLLYGARVWNRREIRRVVLWRPAEGPKAFSHPVLQIERKYGTKALLGVSNDVDLEALAETLHESGIFITLSGWNPGPSQRHHLPT